MPAASPEVADTVVNAGIGRYDGILGRSDAELQTMIRTNVEDTVWAVRAAVAEFPRHPGAGGDIVVVAAVTGLRGGADEAVYAATKVRSGRPVRRAGSRGPTRRNPGHHDLPLRRSHKVAICAGRAESDPGLEDYLRPEDIEHAITTVPRQPRRVRTTQWQLWSMGQSS
jgi:hypothetical protein